MRSFSSRIIFSEDLPSTAPWRPDRLTEHDSSLNEASSSEEPAPPPPPSYEDGLRDGHEAALQQARDESARQRERELHALGQTLARVTQAYTDQLARLQQHLADDVLTLAVAIARSVVTQSLQVQPELIKPAVQAALAELIDGAEAATLRLNPTDLAIVQESQPLSEKGQMLTLVPDLDVRPGGCVIETRHQSIDARIETRWQQALAALGMQDTWAGPGS